MILQAYGTTIAIAVLVGAFVASLEARRPALLRSSGASKKQVWDALPWVLIFGLIGARAYHVCHLWNFYRENLIQVLFLWNGGLGIFGAILGGVVGLGVYLKRGSRGIRGIGEILDLAAPGIAIGQAIGRFANFFSQELYGFPTDLPWGIYINPENRFPGLENFSHFHPLFLYEALWCLLGLVVLEGYKRYKGGKGTRGLLTGERFLFYLSFYALGRFFLEEMRIESWMIGGVRVAQGLSLTIIFASIGSAVVRRNLKCQMSKLKTTTQNLQSKMR